MGVREFAATLFGVEQRDWSPTNETRAVGLSRRVGQGGGSYEGSQAHGAVYACVDLLIRLVAWQMPAEVLRNGNVVSSPSIIANPHPEPQLSAKHWRAAVLESAAMRGFAAGLVVAYEQSGWPRQILPVHPDSIGWSRRDGEVKWKVGGRDAQLWQLGGDLWIAPSPRVPPGSSVGRSVLGHAAASVALGLKAQQFGFDFFDAGGLPVSHLKVDVPEVSEDEAASLKAKFLAATANREPLVSSSALTLDSIPISAEESQFLETIGANVATVCMFFGIPPEVIGGSSGDSMTYDTVNGRNLQLLTNTIGAWMVWLEDVYTSLIPRPQSVLLDPEAMLRTSIPAIYDNVRKALGTKPFLTINEGRELLGYGAVPDGDTIPDAPATPATGGGNNP